MAALIQTPPTAVSAIGSTHRAGLRVSPVADAHLPRRLPRDLARCDVGRPLLGLRRHGAVGRRTLALSTEGVANAAHWRWCVVPVKATAAHNLGSRLDGYITRDNRAVGYPTSPMPARCQHVAKTGEDYSDSAGGLRTVIPLGTSPGALRLAASLTLSITWKTRYRESSIPSWLTTFSSGWFLRKTHPRRPPHELGLGDESCLAHHLTVPDHSCSMRAGSSRRC